MVPTAPQVHSLCTQAGGLYHFHGLRVTGHVLLQRPGHTSMLLRRWPFVTVSCRLVECPLSGFRITFQCGFQQASLSPWLAMQVLSVWLLHFSPSTGCVTRMFCDGGSPHLHRCNHTDWLHSLHCTAGSGCGASRFPAPRFRFHDRLL